MSLNSNHICGACMQNHEIKCNFHFFYFFSFSLYTMPPVWQCELEVIPGGMTPKCVNFSLLCSKYHLWENNSMFRIISSFLQHMTHKKVKELRDQIAIS